MVIRFDPAPGLLDDIRIHRVADVDFRLLAERPRRDPLVADILDVAEHRPLDDLEDHHDPLGNPHGLGADIDKLPAAVEGADVLLDRLHVEDLAGTGDELGELRNLGGVIPLDPHLDDPIRFIDGSQCRRGGLGTRRLGAGEGGRGRRRDKSRRDSGRRDRAGRRQAGGGGGREEFTGGLTDSEATGRQAEKDCQHDGQPPQVSAVRSAGHPLAGDRLQIAEI